MLELHALDVGRMRFSEKGVTFSLAQLTKTSKPEVLFYPALSTDKEVCPVFILRKYLKRTNKDRKGINYSSLTSNHMISKMAKGDSRYQDIKAHSTRGAAVSAAYSQGCLLQTSSRLQIGHLTTCSRDIIRNTL